MKLYKVYKNDQHVAMVTELLTGGEVMERTISEAEICRIIEAVGSTLVYLHCKGITHRDIKRK